jgi:hypothetical protein
MAGNLLATVDYLVTQVQGAVGHARVYNRTRSTRNRAEFEAVFVGPTGLDFWTVRRESSAETHRGASHQATRTHLIRVQGVRAANDEDLATNAGEIAMQDDVEALVELIRTDPSLGWNVEHAQVTEHGVQDVPEAAVACYAGHLVVEAREALHW